MIFRSLLIFIYVFHFIAFAIVVLHNNIIVFFDQTNLIIIFG